MSVVYLVRHGAVVGAETRRFIGQLDVPLSPRGEIQIAAVARRLSPVALRAVYSSDLLRTRQSAYIVAAPHGLALDSKNDLYVSEVTWTFAVSRGRAPEDCHTFQKFSLKS